MDWRIVAERYGDRVYLVARSILQDDALARDVAQDALLKVGTALNGHTRVEDCEAWVLTIAGNAARDVLRRKTRRREVSLDADVADATEPSRRIEDVEQVTRALQSLPAEPRDILLLKFREGLTGPQIAAALGISLEAAWQKLSRAMKLLKSKLEAP
jgi:RNA polymerase sigma-70 factor, ECF subfamily